MVGEGVDAIVDAVERFNEVGVELGVEGLDRSVGDGEGEDRGEDLLAEVPFSRRVGGERREEGKRKAGGANEDEGRDERVVSGVSWDFATAEWQGTSSETLYSLVDETSRAKLGHELSAKDLVESSLVVVEAEGLGVVDSPYVYYYGAVVKDFGIPGADQVGVFVGGQLAQEEDGEGFVGVKSARVSANQRGGASLLGNRGLSSRHAANCSEERARKAR